MDTVGRGGAGTSQTQSRHKKRHMMNIYLTDSDEVAIVDFFKDHEEFYNKTNEHFIDKTKKECQWERFTSNSNLSVKVCNTWFESQWTHYGKLARLLRKCQRDRTGFRTIFTS